ncbi:YrhC family protein [Halalkalibacterium halodurans]|uniref:YrhC family protein n=1 Tax=Halalkalibacterium halodurans TaxID=86665 RepID=UPI002E2274D1|nr:YrhC family protein [Halalkalibacterium halodurans]MED4164611.1 YrhC family protein [Halalkalibacterium halodurans]
MEEKKIVELEKQVEDYRQFSFVLLSLSIFLFIGLVLPPSYAPQVAAEWLIAGIGGALTFAWLFNRKVVQCQQKLFEEEEDQQ